MVHWVGIELQADVARTQPFNVSSYYGLFHIIRKRMHTFSYIFIHVFNWSISAPTGGLGTGNKTRWLGFGNGVGEVKIKSSCGTPW